MIGRRFAAAFTSLAFSFGLASLWVPEAWPFMILQFFLSLALLALFLPLKDFSSRLSFHPLLLLPLAISTLAFLQFLSGHTLNLWETRRASIEWSTFFVAAFLAYNLCLNSKTRAKTLESFALGSTALCLLGIIQNYSAPGKVWWLFDSGFEANVFGPFTYHSKFANFAELGLATAVWSASKRPDRLGLYVSCAAILIACVIAAASRGGVFVILLEALLLSVCFLRHNSLPSRFRFVAVACLVLPIAIAALGTDVFFSRLVTTDLSLDSRWAINLASLEMAKMYFWSGSGMGTWSNLYPEFARFDLGLRINQGHNDWLQWLIEGGLPLLLLTFCIWFAAIRSALLEWWSLGFVFVWLHGFFDYPMQQTPAFAALQLAFWGAALAALSPVGNREKRIRSLDRPYS